MWGSRINPATGRPHRDDKKIKAIRKREDARADAAIAKTKKLYDQRMARRAQRGKSRWN